MSELKDISLKSYRLEQQLRPGRVGQVYKSQDTNTGSTVALKVMQTRLGLQPDERARMLQRLFNLKALSHNNIIAVLDAGDEAGKLFVVSEYTEADSLQALLQRHRLEFKVVDLALGLSLMRQACDAFTEAERHSVVHGDLKPDNMLLVSNARVGPVSKMFTLKIGDFALTRLGDLADDEHFFGSPAYISPEQCQGLPLSTSSDLYSLGVIMYETFTGLLPFEVKNIGEAAIKHLYAEPRKPREVRPEIPHELESLILRLLAKNSGERPSNPSQVRDTLQAILERIEPGGPTPTLVLQEPRMQLVAPEILAPTEASDAPRLTLADDSGRVLRVIPLTGAGLTFGRAAENDVLLNSDTVSRCHLRLDWDGERATVTDLGSSNGTELDGLRLPLQQAVPLPMRGVLRVAPFWLRLEGATLQTRNPIGLVLEEQHMVLAPGSTGTLRLRVANLGRLVDHFAFAIEGIPHTWLQLPNQYLQLNPGHQASVNLGIMPPRLPEARAGAHSLRVIVYSRENRQLTASLPMTLTLLPFASSELGLSPGMRGAVRRTKYVLQIANHGNVSLRYQPTATEADPRLQFRFLNTELLLEPGQTEELEMRVRAPLKWIGLNQLRHFTVGARVVAEQNIVQENASANDALIPTGIPSDTILGHAGGSENNKTKFDATFIKNAAQEGGKRGQSLLGQMSRDVIGQLRDGAFTGRGIDFGRVLRGAKDRVVSDAHGMQRQAVTEAEQKLFAGGQKILDATSKKNASASNANLGNQAINQPQTQSGEPRKSKHPTLVEAETSPVLVGANPAAVAGQFVHRPLLPIWLLLALLALLALLFFVFMRPPSIQEFRSSNPKPFVGQRLRFNWDAMGANKFELRGISEKPIVLNKTKNTYSLSKGFATTEPKTVSLLATNLFGATSQKDLQILPQYSLPRIKEFSIYPKQLIKGQPVLLRYVVENATSVELAPFGKMKNNKGHLKDYPSQPKTYVLTAKNGDKQVEQRIELKVDYMPPEIIGLSITPRTVVKGKDLTMKVYVKTRNASSVDLSGLGSIPESTIEEIATPQTSTTYVLTVKNSRGVTRTRTFTVNVVEPPKSPEPATTEPAKIEPLNIEPAKTETPKSELPITSATPATQVAAPTTPTPIIVQAPPAIPTVPVAKQEQTQLAAPLAPQVVTKPSQQVVEVSVAKPSAVLSVSSNKIISGHKVLLTWKTENARTVRLEPIGPVAKQGRMEVSPSETTKYSLIAISGDGSVARQERKIEVLAAPKQERVELNQNTNSTANSDTKSISTLPTTATAAVSVSTPKTENLNTTSVNQPSQTNSNTPTISNPETPQINIAGQWYLNSGDVLLTQQREKIVGVAINRFDYSRIRIEGTLQGHTVTGKYRLRGRAKTFTWQFDDQATKFSGGGEDGAWCGARTGVAFNDGCSFSGEWITSFLGKEDCSLKLSRIANNVTGTYCDGTLLGKIEYRNGTAQLLGVYKAAKGTSGNFVFALSNAESQEFRGQAIPDLLWCGWRPGRNKPSVCGINN